MSYPCIPTWHKEKPKDEFDYPLRTKNEILLENEISPPKIRYEVIKTDYTAPKKNIGAAVNRSDLRGTNVKILVPFKELKLTPLQKKRLIFLLGNRYKGGDRFKISIRQYTNFEHNYLKALDTLKQLYYETKRAPAFIWEKMTNKQRRFAKKKYLGKTAEEQAQSIDKFEKMYEEDKKRFDELMKDPSNFTQQKMADRWDKMVNGNIKSAEEQEREEIEKRKSIEGLIHKEEHYKKLVNERVLSEKAYKTFFENKLKKE